MTVDVSSGCIEAALSGVLVVAKPSGWTSHDVVAKVRRMLGVRKVGHTGTLDPAATGVLVLCLGRATRIAEYLMQTDKVYHATLRLGVTTDTQDATGTVLRFHDGLFPDEAAIRSAFSKFVGVSQQVPPMFSAVKVKGVPLYKAARAGQTVARSTRVCHIHQLSMESVSPGSPSREIPVPTVDVVFNVVCGKGTYIRTLCADIGDVLGVGGHLLQLERRRVGHFTLDEAVTMEELAEMVGQHGVLPRLHAIADALRQLPALTLDAVSSEGVQHGTGCTAAGILNAEGQWVAGSTVRLHRTDGQLLAIGKVPWNSDDVDRFHSTDTVKIEKVLI